MTVRVAPRGGAGARPGSLAFLVSLVLVTGASTGCRRSQPEATPPAAVSDARAAEANARAKATPDADGPRAETAIPEGARADQPKKPAGLPAQAVWVGGPDGGVFVFLERTNDRRGTFAAKIFHADGELWYAGLLVPAPRDAAGDIEPGQHDQFAGWDGERLLLSDGRWLEPVKTKRPRGPRAR